MKKAKFYVCKKCGNIIINTDGGEAACCNGTLLPLEAQKTDEAHMARVDKVEDEYFITFGHEMSKEHYIGFAAGVRFDSVILTRLYPEQDPEVRIPGTHGKNIYFYCVNHGLFEVSK